MALVVLSALGLSVCGREPTAPPVSAAGGYAQIVLEPRFAEGVLPRFQASGVVIDNVHLVIRNADGKVVLDTVVTFIPGQTEVSITATVMVHGESERFVANYTLRNGTTEMFEGLQDLTARAGLSAPPTTAVPQTFVGPGASAATVTVSPASVSLIAGSTQAFTASVRDNSNTPIPNAIVAWSTSNPLVAAVSTTGLVTAGAVRGSAVITASTISGITGSANVSVILPAARVVLETGNGQTGRVGSTLPQAMQVQVQAADGVGVSGQTVTFAPVAGGSVGTASATTDANGRASSTMTLGGSLGAQSFRATSGLFSVTTTQTATAGLPAAITIVSGNLQADSIGRALGAPFVVRVTDSFSNATPGVTVAWARTVGSGTLSTASSVTDALGQTQASYILGNTPGNETATASIGAGGAPPLVSFSATAIARGAATLTIVSGSPQSGTVGTAAAAPLVVAARDALGNPVAGATVDWTLVGGGALAGASSVTNASGQAQMMYTFGAATGAVTVRAQLATAPTIFATFALTATAGAPAQIFLAGGTAQTAPAGSPVPIAPSVQVADAQGNVLAGVSVTFTAGNGGNVTGSPATTNATGVATVGSWTLGSTPGTQTLTASINGGTVFVTFSATASAPVGPPVLSITTQPSGAVQNTVVFPQQPVIQLKTAAGANLNTAGVVVSVALSFPPVLRSDGANVVTGPVLRGTTTATTNASGVATFAGLSVLGPTGSVTLTFTAGGYTDVTSGIMSIAAGPAVYLMATTATALTGTAGAVVAPNPTVVVKDSSMNVVAGVGVVFAPVAGGNGAVSGGGVTTNGSGLASPTSWTLDAVVGADSVAATSGALVGSPVLFVATSSAGAATQVAIVSGNNQTGTTGTPLAAPMIAIAKDALNNPVSGINLGFSVTAGGGTPASQTIATNAGGQASFTLTLGPPGTQTVQVCLPGCTATSSFTALSIPVGADAVWTGATSGIWSTAANWSPAVVPTGANNVFIPGGTPNTPVLTTPTSVNDLTIANGATLNVGGNTLTVGGNLNAGTTIVGTVPVRMSGAGKQLSGTIPGLLLDLGNTVIAAGTAVINGDLTTNNGSVFDVGPATVTVQGSVGVYGGSRVKMTTAGGHLIVQGGYDSNPGNDVGDAWMTNGILEIKGNLTATNGCCGQGFRAIGSHITRFSGGAPQSINFAYAHEGYHRETFGHVEFTGSNPVTLLNSLRVHGTVLVSNNTALLGNKTIFHIGQLTTTAGTDLSGLASTELNGGGAVFPLVAGLGPPAVNIVGAFTVTLPSASITMPTSVATWSGAVLDLEARSLTVTGNFGMFSGSRVKMTQSGAYFRVNGTYNSDPGNDVGDAFMTAGLLELKGNLQSTNGCCGQGFRAVGAHVTRFSGSAAQSINFAFSHEGYHRETFGHIEFTGGNTVTLLNSIRVHNTVVVNNGTTLTGSSKTIFHIGQLTTQVGTSLAGIASTELDGGGAIFPVYGGTAPPNVHIVGNMTVTLPISPLTLPTNLNTWSGAVLNLNSSSLVVTGGFGMFSGSRVQMTNAAAYFRVDGTYNSDPGNDVGDGYMTAGLLELKGNLQATNGCCGQGFRAVGAHVTRFSGSGPQSINFALAHEGYNRETFGHLEFTGGNTVTLLNSVRVHGTVTVNNNTALAGNTKTIFHIGQLTTTAGTNLSGIASTELNGGGAVFPIFGGVAPPNVNIVGNFTTTLPTTPLTLPTNLAIWSSGVLNLNSQALTVTGNFGMFSGTRVQMTDAGAYFRVDGTYNSDPGNNVGDVYMTAGVLELKGNLQATNGCCGQGFRAVGAHVTRFSGSGPQSINFAYAHENYTRETFGHVEFTGGNTVTLLNSIRVHGTVLVNNNTTLTGGTKTVFHIGQLTATAGTSLAGIGSTEQNGGGAVFPLIAGTPPPNVHIVGNFTTTLPSASVTLPTNLSIWSSGVLNLNSKSLTVTGNFGMFSGTRVQMTDAGAYFRVDGNYNSDPGNDVGDTWMTNGLLEVKGNLQATNGCCGQGFRAVGAHVTRFSGTGAQSITFAYAHEGTHRETFGQLEITNASASGVTVSGGAQVLGNMTNTGRFTIPSTRLLNVVGVLQLGPTSITTNSGTLNRGSCVILSGSPTFSGFSCP